MLKAVNRKFYTGVSQWILRYITEKQLIFGLKVVPWSNFSGSWSVKFLVSYVPLNLANPNSFAYTLEFDITSFAVDDGQ